MKRILFLLLGLFSLSAISCASSAIQDDNVLVLVDNDVGTPFDFLLTENEGDIVYHPSVIEESNKNITIASVHYLVIPIRTVSLLASDLGGRQYYIATDSNKLTHFDKQKIQSDAGGLLSMFAK